MGAEFDSHMIFPQGHQSEKTLDICQLQAGVDDIMPELL